MFQKPKPEPARPVRPAPVFPRNDSLSELNTLGSWNHALSPEKRDEIRPPCTWWRSTTPLIMAAGSKGLLAVTEAHGISLADQNSGVVLLVSLRDLSSWPHYLHVCII